MPTVGQVVAYRETGSGITSEGRDPMQIHTCTQTITIYVLLCRTRDLSLSVKSLRGGDTKNRAWRNSSHNKCYISPNENSRWLDAWALLGVHKPLLTYSSYTKQLYTLNSSVTYIITHIHDTSSTFTQFLCHRIPSTVLRFFIPIYSALSVMRSDPGCCSVLPEYDRLWPVFLPAHYWVDCLPR